MAESGVHTIAYAFPKVKIVTTAVDKEVNDNFHIIPGIGKLLLYTIITNGRVRSAHNSIRFP